MNTNETSQPPGYWFGVIEYRMREKMREALAELDLSRGEWRILHALADGPQSVDDVEAALPPGDRHRRMGARSGRRGFWPGYGPGFGPGYGPGFGPAFGYGPWFGRGFGPGSAAGFAPWRAFAEQHSDAHPGAGEHGEHGAVGERWRQPAGPAKRARSRPPRPPR